MGGGTEGETDRQTDNGQTQTNAARQREIQREGERWVERGREGEGGRVREIKREVGWDGQMREGGRERGGRERRRERDRKGWREEGGRDREGIDRNPLETCTRERGRK